MHHRQTAGWGVALLLLATGLAVFRPGKSEAPATSSANEAAPTKSRSRGALSGTPTQRMDRFRSVWRSVTGGKADPRQAELALELIQSLPPACLKELVSELIHASPDEGDPALLGLIARRIGDLEAERGLQWLAEEASRDPESSAYEALFRPALDGWSESDPTGLLMAYFHDEKQVTFRISSGKFSTWGEDGMGPGIVAKAAAQDPDEVWRLLRTWGRRSMGDEFFEGLDPSQVRYFAGRIKELFQDLDRPGFEHLGGNQESWGAEQLVRKSAAAAWFARHPDEALAWFQEQSPAFGLTAETRESEQGRLAGALSSRLYLKQPERAMAWIAEKPEAFRSAAAAELGATIAASPGLSEEGLADLRTLTGWIGDGPERVRWLNALPAALAAHEEGHRLAEVATILMQNLDLSAAERELLQDLSPP